MNKRCNIKNSILCMMAALALGAAPMVQAEVQKNAEAPAPVAAKKTPAPVAEEEVDLEDARLAKDLAALDKKAAAAADVAAKVKSKADAAAAEKAKAESLVAEKSAAVKAATEQASAVTAAADKAAADKAAADKAAADATAAARAAADAAAAAKASSEKLAKDQGATDKAIAKLTENAKAAADKAAADIAAADKAAADKAAADKAAADAGAAAKAVTDKVAADKAAADKAAASAAKTAADKAAADKAAADKATADAASAAKAAVDKASADKAAADKAAAGAASAAKRATEAAAALNQAAEAGQVAKDDKAKAAAKAAIDKATAEKDAAAKAAKQSAQAAKAAADQAHASAEAAAKAAEQQAAAEKAAAEVAKASPDKSAADKAAADKAAADAGAAAKAATDKAAADKAAADKAAAKAAKVAKAAADKAAASKAAADKAASDVAAASKANTDKAAAAKSVAENLAGATSASEKATADKASKIKAATELAKAEKAAAAQSAPAATAVAKAAKEMKAAEKVLADKTAKAAAAASQYAEAQAAVDKIAADKAALVKIAEQRATEKARLEKFRAPTTMTETASLQPHAAELARPLSSFVAHDSGGSKVVRLRYGSDSRSFNVPVSSRLDVESLKLHIVFANSVSISRERSQLRIRFNGHIVGQVQLDPAYPEGAIDMLIPGDSIHSGSNTLGFEATLNVAGTDASVFSSELWAEIDADASSMTLVSKPREIDTQLSSLGRIVSGAAWHGNYPVSILTATAKPSDALLDAGSYVAQRLALLTGNVPVNVHAARAETVADAKKKDAGLARLHAPYNDVDMVLIGTFDQVKGAVGYGLFDEAAGDEQVMLRRHPLSPSNYVLVVTGRTEDNVRSAARHLTALNLEMAEGDSLSFGGGIETADSNAMNNGLQPRMRYQFGQLGFKRATLTGIGQEATLELKLPADLFAIQEAAIDMSLHLGYAAGLGIDSTVSLLLNGVFQQSLRLNNPDGLLVNDWRIKLPLRSFNPGRNTITFRSNIVPGGSRSDISHMYDQMTFTMFEDSVIRIPDLSHYVRLPNLNLMRNSAFPYAEVSASLIALGKNSPEYQSAALTVAAKMAQVQRRPVFELGVTSENVTNSAVPVMLMAAVSDVNNELWTASPMSVNNGVMMIPVSDAYANEGVPYNSVTRAVGFEKIVEAFAREGRKAGDLQKLDMTRYGLLSEFQSPWTSGSTYSLLVAGDATQLSDSAYRLVDGSVWSKLGGDTTIWPLNNNGAAKVTSLKLSDEYHVGELSLIGKIAYFAITSPLYLLLMVVGLALLLTWITRRLLMIHHDTSSQR